MGRRLVDVVDGVEEYLHYDAAEDKFTIEHVQNVQAIADDVAAKHMETGGKSADGSLWHVGSIPVTDLMKLAKLRGIQNFWDLCKPEYADEIMRFCRDSDNRKLSPTGGKA